MKGFLVLISFAQIAFLSKNCDQTNDPILSGFINAFDDDMTIKSWMKSRNTKRRRALILLKDIIHTVRDVISVINSEKYAAVKSLIMCTYMNIENIGAAYYETCNVIKSVKRILKINYDLKSLDLEAEEMSNLFKNELYTEYDNIYRNLEETILQYGCNFNSKNTFAYLFFSPHLNEYGEKLSVTSNCFSTTIFIYEVRNMLDSMLPEDFETPVYVVINKAGFKSSRTCINDENLCFIREVFDIVCPKDMLDYIHLCPSEEKTKSNNVKIDDFMEKMFTCNKTITKVLISLFHYYSEIKTKNTKFTVILKENYEYEIKWAYSKKPSIKQIKNYWLTQEIPNMNQTKKESIFGPVGKDNIKYSTNNSGNTSDNGIETRLVVLSCGHQLGFELIDKFFRKKYAKYWYPLKCPVCKLEIDIIGSYSTTVFSL